MCFLYLGKRMMEELNFFRDPNFGAPLEALWSDEQVRAVKRSERLHDDLRHPRGALPSWGHCYCVSTNRGCMVPSSSFDGWSVHLTPVLQMAHPTSCLHAESSMPSAGALDTRPVPWSHC